MNVYLTIDPTWSYQFITRNRKALANYDFFIFMDRFTTTGINSLVAFVNYQFDQNSVEYSSVMDQIARMVNDYPDLGGSLGQAFTRLRETHMDALKAIPGRITVMQPIIDDAQLLTGVLFTVDPVRY